MSWGELRAGPVFNLVAIAYTIGVTSIVIDNAIRELFCGMDGWGADAGIQSRPSAARDGFAPVPPKKQQPAILAALAHPTTVALWWRVAVLEPCARTVEVDTPSGWTLADWQAYAERYHGPGCAVNVIAGLRKARAPVNEAIRAACERVGGITPELCRSLLTPEDVADIEAGAIHPRTLRAHALSFAEGMRSGRLVPAARAKP